MDARREPRREGVREGPGARRRLFDARPARPEHARLGADREALAGLADPDREAVYDEALQRARSIRGRAEGAVSALAYDRQRADRFRVEIYKKNSIALACLVFVLVGVPLGLAVPRAGVGLVAALAVFVFLFYWISLVGGDPPPDP